VVVTEFGLKDKVCSITLENASSNTSTMTKLIPKFIGYLDPDPEPLDKDKDKALHGLLHQRCACHIINLIVKSGLKRIKSYLEAFRTEISYLNSSNQRITEFHNFCIVKGVQPHKFGLDMDMRWNSTYLMLKHLIPYRYILSVFVGGNLQLGGGMHPSNPSLESVWGKSRNA
jgi:hypothetical protein